MTLRHLLVHLDKTDASALRADLAIAMAKRFGARLTALYAVRDPDVPSVASQNRYVFVERAAGKAHAAFGLHAASSGIEAEWDADIGASDLEVSRAVVLRSRVVDLVVLGQHDADQHTSGVPAELVEDTVLHAGRPVLVVPHAGRFASFGERTVVAWNNSREATRAVHDALPLLAVADTVTLVAMVPTGRTDTAAETAELDAMVRHLTDHGIRATGDRLVFDPSRIEPVERLLSYLAEAGAGLLVMGAAGQQRGAAATKRSLTRRLLEQMTVPTLLSY
jgi:nucleotide-binding universal stress UspA family protein